VAARIEKRMRFAWKSFARMPDFHLRNLFRELSPWRYAELHRRNFARFIGDRLHALVGAPVASCPEGEPRGLRHHRAGAGAAIPGTDRARITWAESDGREPELFTGSVARCVPRCSARISVEITAAQGGRTCTETGEAR
jgi:hypothetical protein